MQNNRLTNNQLSHVLPVQLTALLMDNGDCDSALDSLVEFKTKKRVKYSHIHKHHLSMTNTAKTKQIRSFKLASNSEQAPMHFIALQLT